MYYNFFYHTYHVCVRVYAHVCGHDVCAHAYGCRRNRAGRHGRRDILKSCYVIMFYIMNKYQ
jgi:hypothetical protein